MYLRPVTVVAHEFRIPGWNHSIGKSFNCLPATTGVLIGAARHYDGSPYWSIARRTAINERISVRNLEPKGSYNTRSDF